LSRRARTRLTVRRLLVILSFGLALAVVFVAAAVGSPRRAVIARAPVSAGGAVVSAHAVADSVAVMAPARGRALIFFNQYCVTCKQDASLIAAWALKAKGRYSMTGVGFAEQQQQSKAFARSLGWHFAVEGDPTEKIAQRYGVAVPTIIVLIADGHMRLLDYSRWPGAAAASVGTPTVSRETPKSGDGKPVVSVSATRSVQAGGRAHLTLRLTTKPQRCVLRATSSENPLVAPVLASLRPTRTVTRWTWTVPANARSAAWALTVTCALPNTESASASASLVLRGRGAGKLVVAVGVRSQQSGATLQAPGPAPTPVVVVHPTFVSSFDWQASVGQDRYVLIRYLRLAADAGTNGDSADAAFAKGAATPTAGVTALAVTCGQPSVVTGALRAAKITAPVIVDTNAACTTELDTGLDGITETNSGPERLFTSAGAPLASMLVVGADFAAYNESHSAAPVAVASWMGGLSAPGDVDGTYGASALDVPVPENVQPVRDLSFIPSQGEIAIRGFWYVCPSCVADQSDYQLQSWASAHPQAPVVSFTCDSNVNEAADWAYEHAWTLPVYVYDGPLDFSSCVQQLEQARLGMTYYGQTVYSLNGTVVPDAPFDYNGLPGGIYP
jgi:hypothetical protein